MKKIFIILFYILLNTKNLCLAESTKLQLEIYKNLRCLVCQGQSIADSNSDFAQTIKLVVQDQISEGKSKKEIYDFLISKYGEWIVYKPRLNKSNFLLWFLPYLVMIFGGIVIFILLKKRKNHRYN
tara:strand:+ start:27 stop:404 length:378 start_codon:yes stop_codon:yes gene_type:complete